ncbi:FimV/HubP family polar landmark protein, partial [Pseudoalteromonas luteoviolacea]
ELEAEPELEAGLEIEAEPELEAEVDTESNLESLIHDIEGSELQNVDDMLEALEVEADIASLDEELMAEEVEIDLGDDPLGDEVDLLSEEPLPEQDFVTPSEQLDSYPELELEEVDDPEISLAEASFTEGVSEAERQLAESLESQKDLNAGIDGDLEASFDDELDDLFDDLDDEPHLEETDLLAEPSSGASVENDKTPAVIEDELDDLGIDLDTPFDEDAAMAAMDEERLSEPEPQMVSESSELQDLEIDLDTPFDESAALASIEAEGRESIIADEAGVSEKMDLAQNSGISDAELELDVSTGPEEFLAELDEISEAQSEVEPPVDIDESAIEDAFMADLEETNFDALLDEYAEPEEIERVEEPELEVDFDALLSEDLDEKFEIEEETPQEASSAMPEDFLEIDDLIAESDDAVTMEEPYQEPNMDVGLDDFEELLAGDNPTDVDLEEGGFSAKLDLARAYLEIEDFDSAVSALDDVMENGPSSVQEEARLLKEQIK